MYCNFYRPQAFEILSLHALHKWGGGGEAAAKLLFQ